MQGVIYRETFSGKTQGGGAFTLPANELATEHQLTVIPVSPGAAGTLAVEVLPTGGDDYTTLKGSDGNDLSLDMTVNETVTFSGVFTSVRLTPTAYDGTSYKGALVGWKG